MSEQSLGISRLLSGSLVGAATVTDVRTATPLAPPKTQAEPEEHEGWLPREDSNLG